MQFNEFIRRLHHCHIDEGTKFLLTHMFEAQVTFSRELDATISVVSQMMDRVQSVLNVNESLIQELRALQKRGIMDGVEVHSVQNDPEEG